MDLLTTFLDGKFKVYQGLNTHYATNIPIANTLDDLLNREDCMVMAVESPDLVQMLLESSRASKFRDSNIAVTALGNSAISRERIVSIKNLSDYILEDTLARLILLEILGYVEILVQYPDSFDFLKANTTRLNDFFNIEQNRILSRDNYELFSNTMLYAEKSSASCKFIAVLTEKEHEDITSWSHIYDSLDKTADYAKAYDYLINSRTIFPTSTSSNNPLGYAISSFMNKEKEGFGLRRSFSNMCSRNETSNDYALSFVLDSTNMDVLNLLAHPDTLYVKEYYMPRYSYSQGENGYYGSRLLDLVKKNFRTNSRLPLIGNAKSASYSFDNNTFFNYTSIYINRYSSDEAIYLRNSSSDTATRNGYFKNTDPFDLTNVKKVVIEYEIKNVINYCSNTIGITDNPDCICQSKN